MKFKFLFILLISMSIFALTTHAAEQKYGKPKGEIPLLCERGGAQSPFDVKATLDADMPDIIFSYKPFTPEIINDGYTIQVNAPKGSKITIGNDSFELLQFHFHTPSEYHIDSKAYPMEVHFVHQRNDGALGVVGVMFEEGKANAEIEKIWSNIPKEPGQKNKPKGVTIDITKLLPSAPTYYRFMGSLTTPPYSEGVHWFIMTEPITVSKEQVEAFRAIFPMNARSLQPVNDRLIVRDIK